MKHKSPMKLNIGLPVFNGENYLEGALASILSQTFGEFELIISDNGSTDGTERICRSWAARDSRIRYIRNDRNVGAAPNFNHVFELSNADYFKWIAHDDMHEPRFLETCIQALDSDPFTVVAYCRATTIDWRGERVREWGCEPALGAADPVVRFRASLAPPVDPLPLPLFGVIRADALRRTPLQAGYAGCDRVLLTELSLYGRFHEISEPLFLQREHKDRAGPVLSRTPGRAAEFWLGTQSQKPGSPLWQSLSAYSRAVFRAPMRIRDRMRCHGELLAWMMRERGGLIHELIRHATYTPVLGPGVRRLHEKYRIRRWQRDIRCLARDIESLVPEKASFILVDEGNFVGTNFLQRHPIAFLEREGQYWGPPANDNDAIRALDEMRKKGAGFLVVAWPAFWWMDYYSEWTAYIRSRFPCIEQNERIRIFDLRNIVEHSHGMPAGHRKKKGGPEAGKSLCY